MATEEEAKAKADEEAKAKAASDAAAEMARRKAEVERERKHDVTMADLDAVERGLREELRRQQPASIPAQVAGAGGGLAWSLLIGVVLAVGVAVVLWKRGATNA